MHGAKRAFLSLAEMLSAPAAAGPQATTLTSVPTADASPIAPAGAGWPIVPAGAGWPIASAGAGWPIAPAADGLPIDPIRTGRSIDSPENSAPGAAAIVGFEPCDVATDYMSSAHFAAIRSARLFHAAVADGLESMLAGLVGDVTVEIVARELRLGDCDIAGIARRLIAERQAEEPLRLHVAPGDANVMCDLPVLVDSALEPGDAILECRTGTIDARLGVRLAAVIAAQPR